MLSARYRSDDQLWFSFFHEAARAIDDREPHPHERPRSNVSRRRSRGHAPRAAAQPRCIRYRVMHGRSATHRLQRMRTTVFIDAFEPRSSSPRRLSAAQPDHYQSVKSAPRD